MAYTEDELALLATTPQLIGSAVASASSSGLFGTGKELFATASSVMKGVKSFPNNTLLKQLVLDASANRQQAIDQMKKFRDWGLARLKQKGVDSGEKVSALAIEDCKAVAALLAGKASPEEAKEYRQWAYSVAENVANAASEGGFLGFGGEKVSDPEKQLLAKIRGTLGEMPSA